MTKKELADILKLIGEENRLYILCELLKNKKLNVTEIAVKINASVATASHHLKSLENGGILLSQKSGKEVYYSLADMDMMSGLKDLICKNTKL